VNGRYQLCGVEDVQKQAETNPSSDSFLLKEVRTDGKMGPSLFNQEGNGKHMTIISAVALMSNSRKR